MTPEPESLRDFRAVYRSHYGFVWHALHRFGTHNAVLDDAVQDVFVTAYRRRDDFSGESAKAWLYGIARRTASNYRRAHQRRQRREDAFAVTVRAPNAEVMHEAIETLDRYLASLSPRDRELFVLSELEGMTGPELAAVTGRNVQTIYTRVRKLRTQLRELLEELPRVRQRRPQATAQSWALLVPALQKVALPVAVASATTAATWGWVGAAVGVGVLAMVTLRAATVGDPPALAPTVAAAPVAADAAAQPRKDVPTAVPTPPPDRDAIPRPTVAAPPPTKSPSRPAKRPNNDRRSEVGEEIELLQRARALLREGNAAAALDTTDKHARKYPSSAFGDIRRALRIDALCASGRGAQARGEAEAFLRGHPDSPVAEKIRRACPEGSYKAPDPDMKGA